MFAVKIAFRMRVVFYYVIGVFKVGCGFLCDEARGEYYIEDEMGYQIHGGQKHCKRGFSFT